MRKAIQIAYDHEFRDQCAFAAAGGFKDIAISFCEEDLLGKTKAEWTTITETVANTLEKNNLQLIQTHAFMYSLRLSSEIIRPEIEAAFDHTIRLSGEMGAGWCVFHPRTSVNSGFRPEVSLEDNKRDFSTYLELGIQCGTGIAVENMPIFNHNFPIMPYFGYNCGDLCSLVDSLNDEHFGICWDTGHANMVGFDQAEAIQYMGNRIKCTHLHNNFGRSDDHATPEQGNVPWEKVMPTLKKANPDCLLTLETHCRYSEPELLVSFARHNLACLDYLERVANME